MLCTSIVLVTGYGTLMLSTLLILSALWCIFVVSLALTFVSNFAFGSVNRLWCNKPSLILADEPTGNLDYANAQGVFDILSELQQDFNTALLMVTHDRQLAKLADKQLALQSGVWVS